MQANIDIILRIQEKELKPEPMDADLGDQNYENDLKQRLDDKVEGATGAEVEEQEEEIEQTEEEKLAA